MPSLFQFAAFEYFGNTLRYGDGRLLRKCGVLVLEVFSAVCFSILTVKTIKSGTVKKKLTKYINKLVWADS